MTVNDYESQLVQERTGLSEADIAAQQRAQWGIIQQRLRHADQSAGHDRREPVQAAPQHRPVVRAVHVVAAEIAPDPLQLCHRDLEAARLGGEHDRIHGACGGPADDAERIDGPFRHQFRDRFQDTDLKGAPGAAAGQHQCGRFAAMPLCHNVYIWLQRDIFRRRSLERIIVPCHSHFRADFSE